MENIKTFEKVIEELCEKIGHKNISWEKSYMIENIENYRKETKKLNVDYENKKEEIENKYLE